MQPDEWDDPYTEPDVDPEPFIQLGDDVVLVLSRNDVLALASAITEARCTLHEADAHGFQRPMGVTPAEARRLHARLNSVLLNLRG